MKTLIVLCMAIAAIVSSPIEEEAKNELIQSMEKIFWRPHKYSQNGIPVPQDPPVRFDELTKTMDAFKTLDDEEKDEIRNHLFGDRHPRPRPARPAHQHARHHMDEEKLKEFHEKWEAMTAEEREEFISNRIQKFKEEHIVHRLPRPMHRDRPQFPGNEEKTREFNEKWESMTQEEREEARNNKRQERQQKYESQTPEDEELLKDRVLIVRFPQRHHHERDHPHHFDEEKLKEMHEKWEAMTEEERKEHIKNFREKHEELKMRHPRSIQAIKPLPEIVGSLPYPVPQRPIGRNFQQIRPLPEMTFPMVRPAARGFQPIVPLPEYNFPMVMPAHPDFKQIMPLSDEYALVFPVENNGESSEEITIEDEEQLLALFPEGIPIEVVPAETGKNLHSRMPTNQRQGPMVRPTPEGNLRPMPVPRQFQPIEPIPEVLGVPY